MPKPLRVLFVEDSEDDMFFELQALKHNDFEPEFERVQSASTLAAALNRQVWDVVISDHSMPGFNSLQALELLKRRQLDIPFIVVSGVIGEEAAVKAMKAGASDYVMKSALARLAPTIERELREAANRRERAQAEKALQRSQYELNDFFENAPIGLHWTGPDGSILRVNATELAILGYAQPEFVGHHVSEFFVDQGAAASLLTRLQDRESIHDFDAQLRCLDGTIRSMRINANALWEDGKFVRARWFVWDVTDRKRLEEATAYLGAIVEYSDDAIIGTDLQGSIQSWNAGAARMYGYSAQEALGCSLQMLVPASCLEEPQELRAKLMAGKQLGRHESVRLRKDGQTIPVSYTFSPIKDSDGAIVGFSAIERDISARLQEEEERLRLIQDLSEALSNIKTLRGLLPICASCKSIRDDQGYWNRLETYLTDHSQVEFAHALCPACQSRLETQAQEALRS